MAIAQWVRNSSAARMLTYTASASLDTLKQTTKSNPGSGIPPAMALASAALLGVVSTFSWSNVLNEGKLKGLLEEKHQRQELEQQQEELQDEGQWSAATGQLANAARRELESLLRP